MAATGVTEESMRGFSAKPLIVSFFLLLDPVIILGLAVERFDIIYWPNGITLGLRLTVGLYAFNLCSDFLFEGRLLAAWRQQILLWKISNLLERSETSRQEVTLSGPNQPVESDLAELDQLYRIIAFRFLGLLVLSGSFLYLRFRHRFLTDDNVSVPNKDPR